MGFKSIDWTRLPDGGPRGDLPHPPSVPARRHSRFLHGLAPLAAGIGDVGAAAHGARALSRSTCVPEAAPRSRCAQVSRRRRGRD